MKSEYESKIIKEFPELSLKEVKMKPEYESKIIKEFPELFRDTNLSPQESCMCFGIDIGDGWYSIIYSTCKAINSHLKKLKDINKPLDYKFTQIKEKFATIRIYDNGGDEFIDGVIAMAEHLSSITCEECGKLGKIHTKGCWLKTLCDEDAKKLGYVGNIEG